MTLPAPGRRVDGEASPDGMTGEAREAVFSIGTKFR
jgi:hypothetical protein